ncbi:MAG: hypothetical protein BWX98_01761 [Candidatus Aminicenantes bacterium ADurb.Bin147]|nr:MAG: hypothetical protein BWX98_01761 [Candidatus Aminicenantes bacterium ADurb.Bin147]
MERVASGLGQDVDRRARVGSVFGLGSQGHDPDLLDGVVVDPDQRSEGGAARVGGVDAVDEKDILVGGAAVSRRARHPAARAAVVEHAGRRQGQVIERIPARRQLGKHLRLDLGVDRRRFRVDDGRGAHHFNRLVDVARRESQVDDQTAPRRDHDAFLNDGFEIFQGRRDLVFAGRQIQENKRSPGGGDGRPLPRDEGRAGHLHVDAGQRFTGVVGNRSRDFSGENRLTARRQADPNDQQDDGQQGRPHVFSIPLHLILLFVGLPSFLSLPVPSEETLPR